MKATRTKRFDTEANRLVRAPMGFTNMVRLFIYFHEMTPFAIFERRFSLTETKPTRKFEE